MVPRWSLDKIALRTPFFQSCLQSLQLLGDILESGVSCTFEFYHAYVVCIDGFWGIGFSIVSSGGSLVNHLLMIN